MFCCSQCIDRHLQILVSEMAGREQFSIVAQPARGFIVAEPEPPDVAAIAINLQAIDAASQRDFEPMCRISVRFWCEQQIEQKFMVHLCRCLAARSASNFILDE